MSGMQTEGRYGLQQEESETEDSEELAAISARGKRLVSMTREICEYGFEVRQRMFERLDEKMGYKK